jgi:hypothetical protein
MIQYGIEFIDVPFDNTELSGMIQYGIEFIDVPFDNIELSGMIQYGIEFIDVPPQIFHSITLTAMGFHSI